MLLLPKKVSSSSQIQRDKKISRIFRIMLQQKIMKKAKVHIFDQEANFAKDILIGVMQVHQMGQTLNKIILKMLKILITNIKHHPIFHQNQIKQKSTNFLIALQQASLDQFKHQSPVYVGLQNVGLVKMLQNNTQALLFYKQCQNHTGQAYNSKRKEHEKSGKVRTHFQPEVDIIIQLQYSI